MDFRTKGIGHFNQILKSKNAMDNWTFGQKELDNSATAEIMQTKCNWTFGQKELDNSATTEIK